MSAHKIFDQAPLGAVIAWSDGKPQPFAFGTEAFAAWKQRNGCGHLISKTCRSVMGQYRQPAGFIVMRQGLVSGVGADKPAYRHFEIDSDLHFVIVKRPPVGSCRIFNGPGEDAELLHLASTRTHADAWVSNLGSRDMVIAEVTADEIAADHIEGRIAA